MRALRFHQQHWFGAKAMNLFHENPIVQLSLATHIKYGFVYNSISSPTQKLWQNTMWHESFPVYRYAGRPHSDDDGGGIEEYFFKCLTKCR